MFVLRITLWKVNDEPHIFSAPEVAIKLPTVEGILSPIMVKEPSYNVKAHWKIFDYEFKVNKEEIKAFDLIFISNVEGCSVPNLNYKLNHNTVYSPFVVPSM